LEPSARVVVGVQAAQPPLSTQSGRPYDAKIRYYGAAATSDLARRRYVKQEEPD